MEGEIRGGIVGKFRDMIATIAFFFFFFSEN